MQRKRKFNSATVWITVIFLFVAITIGAVLSMVYNAIRNQEWLALMRDHVNVLADNADNLIVNTIENQIASRLAAKDPEGTRVAALARSDAPPSEAILTLYNAITEINATTRIASRIELYIPSRHIVINEGGIRFLADSKNAAIAAQYAFLHGINAASPQWFQRPSDPASEPNDALTFIREYPLGLDASGQLPLLMVSVHEDILGEELRRSLRILDENTQIFITDIQGIILYAPDEALLGTELPVYQSSLDAVTLANGQTVHLAEMVSKNGLWSYVLAAGQQGRPSMYDRMVTVWIGISVLLLVVGLLGVLWVQLQHYARPMRRLMQHIHLPEPPASSPGRLQSPQAHFEQIELALSDMHDERQALETFVEQSRDSLRTAWLNRFIAGEAVYLDPLPQLDIHFPYPRFQVALLKEIDANEAASIIAPLISEDGLHHELFITPQRDIVLLLNHGLPGDALLSRLDAIIAACQRRGFSVTIGIGADVSSPDQTPQSYESAQQALSSRYYERARAIYMATEADDAGDAQASPVFQQLVARIGKIVNDLYSQSAQKALEQEIGLLIDALRTLRPSLSTVRTLMMVAAVHLTKPAYDLHTDPAAIFGEDLVSIYYALPDVEAFRSRLLADCRKLVAYVADDNSESNRSVVQYAIHYIRNTPPDQLSIQSVADALGISASHLSRLFHQETNTKFVDFLQEVKMENARRLLQDPGLSLEQVCAMVGYSKLQYFSAKFKERYGITPRQYQRQHLAASKGPSADGPMT